MTGRIVREAAAQRTGWERGLAVAKGERSQGEFNAAEWVGSVFRSRVVLKSCTMVTVRSLGREHGEEAMALKAIIDRGPSAAICSASTLETQSGTSSLVGSL